MIPWYSGFTAIIPSDSYSLYLYSSYTYNFHGLYGCVVDQAIVFLDKARIPVQGKHSYVQKLNEIRKTWKDFNKESKRSSSTFQRKRTNFCDDLEYLFDIANVDALARIKVEKTRQFPIPQKKRVLMFLYRRIMIAEQKI